MARDDDAHDVVLKTMAFTLVGDLLLAYHGSAAPTDAEWNQWIEHNARAVHRGTLALTEGGSPNSAQRGRIADVVRGQTQPFALMTDSAVIRSVLTAFSWLLGSGQAMKAFASADLEGALKWLKVEVQPERVHLAVARLRQALARAGAVKSR